MAELEERIFCAAKEEGFDAVGICAAEALDKSAEEGFRDWLNCGLNAGMKWLGRNIEKRFNPKLLLEGAESLIIFRANFFRRTDERRVALYAQSEDYHDVLRRKLERISQIIKETGGRTKICVDSTPVAEKLFAAKAGLGWIGKNGLLTTKQNGPWSFLGILISTVKLREAGYGLSAGGCGACNKCVLACPNKALSQRGLDARKCINYLSIEKPEGLLDEAERAMLGDKLFGCDECLRACPFGNRADETNIAEFRDTMRLPADATRKTLAAAAGNTPVKRAFRGNESAK